MKYVLLYEAVAPSDMPRVMQLFPAHKAQWQAFAERGELLAIGPFADPSQGAMGIFTTREAAEAFLKVDPFVLEGIVKAWHVREWREALLP